MTEIKMANRKRQSVLMRVDTENSVLTDTKQRNRNSIMITATNMNADEGGNGASFLTDLHHSKHGLHVEEKDAEVEVEKKLTDEEIEEKAATERLEKIMSELKMPAGFPALSQLSSAEGDANNGINIYI